MNYSGLINAGILVIAVIILAAIGFLGAYIGYLFMPKQKGVDPFREKTYYTPQIFALIFIFLALLAGIFIAQNYNNLI